MKIRTLVYLIILLLVVNVAAISTIVYHRVTGSRGEMRMPFDHEDGPPPSDMPRLSLEERMAIERSRQQVDSLVTPLAESVNALRGKLLDELKNDSPDTNRVYQLISEIGALQSAIQKQMVAQFLNDRDSLRPEQRKRLLKMIEERSRWQERKHLGGRRMNRDF